MRRVLAELSPNFTFLLSVLLCYMRSCFSCVRLFAAPWIAAHQASLSMEFSRQEYWSGLPFLSPGDLPNPGIKPRSSTLQADYLPFEPGKHTREVPKAYFIYLFISFFPKHILDNIFTSLLWLSPCSQINTILLLKIRRRPWHPTPVLLPGKSHGGGVWWAAVHGVTKSQTRLSNFTFTFHFHALEKEMATHSSILAWRIPGMGELAGCRVWGCTESDTTEVT